ncbi:tetratricopeptide repeat protein [Actinomyces oris]|uniref:tetratricopeptide repeat protein n=1 Tax=Actinomyces oris TaxID=544580 RepID=UPI0028D17383|nr:tetratricopeptide repeat protein [Actinomyces oris]
MTEPSPSPIPTTSSSQSWLDSLDPLNHLWKEQPFVAYVITALALPLAIWLGKRAWKTWERRQRTQRITARKQQLPPVRLPFTVEVGYQRLTLEPAQPQQNFAPEGMSIVRLLSAKSTPVPFLDRAEALTRLETWARSEERFAIHVLGGDGGSGKTRLGVELCRRLTTPSTHHQGAEVWQAGFLQNIERSDNTSSSNDASSLLLVIDYAEARPEVVTEVINVALQAAEDPERRRVRIVFLVRRPSPLSVTHQSSNKWLDALRPQKSQNEGVNLILDEASTIILSDEGLSDREREELFEAAYRSFTEPSESSPASDIIEQLNDPMYSQPLLVTVDAFLNARPQSRTQQSCSPSELFEEVLCHEEHYWAEHWPSSLAVNADRHHQTEGTATPTDTQGNLNRKLARQAVAAATLTDIQDEEDAISLLNLLPANPGKNTKDLARWLRNCYPPHMNANGQPALWCEHLEPDRIGEHLVASAADDLVPLLRELLSPSRAGTSSLRTWTALERASTDPRLNEQVGRIINDVLVEVTQAVHAQTINSQSPDLAAGFAKLVNAVRPHIDPNKAHEAQQTLSDSGYFTALLEYELAQCSANILPPTDDSSEIDRATYASRRLSLSRCLANIGRHDEALKAVREATKLYRTLAEHNPGTYTPNLASSLNNLAGSQAENGQPHDALQTVHEATNLYRTLAKHNPAAYTPDLAMCLINLAIRLADNGQQREALQTAQEATNLYRTLAEHNPAAHTPNLAASLNNLANRQAENGQQREALQTAQEAVTIRRNLVEHNPAAHTPDLASSLNNLAIHLAGNGQQREALQIAQEATNLYRTLAEHNPAAHTPNLATSLNTYADILERSGNTKEAARIRKERDEVLKRMKETEEGRV